MTPAPTQLPTVLVACKVFQHLLEDHFVPFEVVAGDIERGKPVRVLDCNGMHILDSFSLTDLGRPIPHEH